MGNDSIVFVYSYHHMNTMKIAKSISDKINALLFDISKQKVSLNIEDYDLVGFGSGIDSGKHYPELLKFVDELPNVNEKKAFIFSTSAIYSESKKLSDHKVLRDILVKKGYAIIDEFSCLGFNTNSFLKYIGGMNKGRPNIEDISKAELFAEMITKNRL